MTDMRNIINLVESMNDEQVNEAGFISRMANKGLATIGNKKAQGKVSKDDLSKKLSDNYYRWLGRTNKAGTLADLQQFFQQINFTNEQINTITHSVITTIEQNPEQQQTNQATSSQPPQSSNDNSVNANQNNTTNESILFELNANDFELTRNEVQQIMDTAAAYSFEHGLYGRSSNQQSSQQTANNQQTNTNQQSNNQNKQPALERNGSVTRANLFTNPVMNSLNDLGVTDSQVRDMAGTPANLKFDQMDQTERDLMAKIGYTILKYNKTGLQQ